MRRLLAWVPLLAAPTLLSACGGSDQTSALPLRSCQTTLVYTPSASIQGGVSVEGEWSSLGPPGQPMTANPDGSYSLTLTLDPRDYAYALLVNGSPVRDPNNPYTRWVGGAEYSLLRVGDCHAPQIQVKQFSAGADGEVKVAGQVLDGANAKGIDASGFTLTLDGAALPQVFDPKTGKITLDKFGVAPGKHAIRINAKDRAGQAADEVYLPFWVEQQPYRWGDGAMYFAFTDRFLDGNPGNDQPVPSVETPANYQGGDWAGITQKINDGYFDKLGVRSIWLSPVDRNPDNAFPSAYASDSHLYSGYHGYWPSAPRETQPRFGSLDDLKALTAAAHAHGIRVLGDLVINHVHEQHPYYVAHKDEGWFSNESQCTCGVTCGWDKPLTCWFASYLPDYNWKNPEMEWTAIGDALWWIKEADLDGFRLDAVKHVDDVAVVSLAAQLREIGDRTGVHYYLVGETFAGTNERPLVAHDIGHDGLDGQFDFPLFWTLRNAFTQRTSNGTRIATFVDLDAAVAQSEAAYPAGALMSPFMGNHDVTRFESAAEAPQTYGDSSDTLQAWNNPPAAHGSSPQAFLDAKFAFAFLLTQPGVPLIYYGDEIGMPGAGDPDNRRMMRFGSDLTAPEADLLAFVQKVGQARRASKGLQRGSRTALVVEPDFYVYQRDDLDSTNGAIVALNRTGSARQVTLTLTGNLGKGDLTFTDALAGTTASSHAGQVTLSIPAQSAAIYVSP